MFAVVFARLGAGAGRSGDSWRSHLELELVASVCALLVLRGMDTTLSEADSSLSIVTGESRPPMSCMSASSDTEGVDFFVGTGLCLRLVVGIGDGGRLSLFQSGMKSNGRKSIIFSAVAKLLTIGYSEILKNRQSSQWRNCLPKRSQPAFPPETLARRTSQALTC